MIHIVTPPHFYLPAVLSHIPSVAVVVPATLLFVLVLSVVVLRHELPPRACSEINGSKRQRAIQLSQRLGSDGQSRLSNSWRWLRLGELLWTFWTWKGAGRLFWSMIDIGRQSAGRTDDRRSLTFFFALISFVGSRILFTQRDEIGANNISGDIMTASNLLRIEECVGN